jgi:hypothetical protein
MTNEFCNLENLINVIMSYVFDDDNTATNPDTVDTVLLAAVHGP